MTTQAVTSSSVPMASIGAALPPRVSDFIWDSIGPVRANTPTGREAPLDATMLRRLTGQFALHREVRGTHELSRDALGVNKLFFAIGADETVVSSNYWIDLLRAGHRQVWSVPAGHVVRIAPAARALTAERFCELEFPEEGTRPLREHGVRIRARLDDVFQRIRRVAAGRPLYVTLSGGLDSTGIAALAREHLGAFTAVTFALARPAADGAAVADEPPGSDLHAARRVAAEIGVPLEVVSTGADDLLDLLDDVLLHGQDFRDFNVHCGLVNAALGAAIASRHVAGPRPLVLTGDTMNELLADYEPETYRGATYYPLPRLARGRLRRHLVAGLDAGDREVGILARMGVDVIQPYALAADAYAALPDAAVATPDAKRTLVECVLGRLVPRFVYDRPKVRAQVGGADGMGTMGLMLDRGLDATWLEHRFAELFALDPAEVKGTIRAGRYRFPTSYPVGDRS